jgi:hypothetical protein
MAKNISLLGADYPDVPSVTLPQTGGGIAVFTDVSDTTAEAADVVEGVVFYTANGVRTVGTLSLTGLIKTVTKTKSYSLGAGAGSTFDASDFGFSTPSGYSYCGIVRWYTDNGDVVLYSCGGADASGATFCKIKNISSSSKSGTLKITVMYVRTDAYS